MPNKAKINKVTKVISQVDNKAYLNVEFDIVEDGTVTETRRLGYPLGTSAKNIEDDLKKYCATYFDDRVLAERSKEVEAADKAANQTITTLEGKEIVV